MDTKYTEFDIRTVGGDSRKYHIAKFAQKGAARNDSSRQVPDFGSELKPPVYMKYEEVPAPPETVKNNTNEDDELEEIEGGRFRRRRRYFHKKEHRWSLYDKKKRNVYYGIEEAQNSNYVVFIPPSAQGMPFQVVPIENWFNFKPSQKFSPLTMEQAEQVIEKKMNITSSRMKKLVERQKEEYARKRQSTAINESSEEEGEKEEQEDANIFAIDSSEGRKPKKPVDEEEIDEEDIEVSAIDRIMYRGADSFADVVDDPDAAQDNEDDGEEIAAEEAREGEERLLQGAEDIREAAEEDEMDEVGEDKEEEYEEDVEDVLNSDEVEELNELDEDEDEDVRKERMEVFSKKYYRPMERLRHVTGGHPHKHEPADPKEASRKRKLEETVAESKETAKEQDVATETNSKVSSEPKPKKPAPEKKSLEDSIAEILRHNRGRLKTKVLLKEAKRRGLVEDVSSFKAALMRVCNIEDDVVNGKMLVLKK